MRKRRRRGGPVAERDNSNRARDQDRDHEYSHGRGHDHDHDTDTDTDTDTDSAIRFSNAVTAKRGGEARCRGLGGVSTEERIRQQHACLSVFEAYSSPLGPAAGGGGGGGGGGSRGADALRVEVLFEADFRDLLEACGKGEILLPDCRTTCYSPRLRLGYQYILELHTAQKHLLDAPTFNHLLPPTSAVCRPCMHFS